MKIKMQGSELKKVDIEYLSLVKRGANRAPFKVIKAEDANQAGGMVNAVKKFFQVSEPNPKVVAIFVEKSALEKAVPNLAAAGFDVTNYDVQDGCVVFKQEGFAEAKAVVMVKSESRVGLAVTHVAKYADCFSGSLSFDDNVASSGFYPGLNTAIGALQSTICNILCETHESGQALGQIQGEVKAFSDYVTQMLKALPEEVWKFESLQRGFGGGTVALTDEVKVLTATLMKAAGAKEEAKLQADDTTGENANRSTSTTSSEVPGTSDDSSDDEASRKAKMNKADDKSTPTAEDLAKAAAAASSTTTTEVDGKKKPQVYKDQDGKEFILVKHADGTIVKQSPIAKMPEGATEHTMPWDQDGALGGTNNGNGQGQGKAADTDTQADNALKYTGAGGLKKEEIQAMLTEAFAPVAASFTELKKTVEEQGKTLAKQGEQIGSIEKTAKEAVSKAERTVVHVQPNYDTARENLGGGVRRQQSVRKAESRPTNLAKAEYPEELWTGLLGALEHHVPGSGD